MKNLLEKLFGAPNKGANYGEIQAAKYLKKHGYKIIDTNFRQKCGEIDIIASKDGVLAIVEVKQRETNTYYNPRDAVNAAKQRRIKKTAEIYIMKNKIKCNVTFDVIEVVGSKSPKIVHLKNAF